MLVGAPQVDVAKAEGVPPGVEHGTVETEDALASDDRRGRSKRGEAIIDAGRSGSLTRDSKCQRVRTSPLRASARMTPSRAVRSAAVVDGKSNFDKASRNEALASSR